MRMLLLTASVLLAGGLAVADVTHESFSIADENGDGKITKDEFYGFAGDAGIYADYDFDSDGFIDETEFDDRGLNGFDDWDMDDDTYLSDDEFHEGYFNFFDDDEDGHWDSLEWDDAGDAGLFDV